MLNGQSLLVGDLRAAVRDDPFWSDYLNEFISHGSASFSIHVAVLIQPYLQFILNGQKTVESRFSTRRFAPYRRVRRGDVVLLKESGGPIVGLCQILSAWFYELDPDSWKTIRKDFTRALCAQDPAFWKEREKATFATLMRIQHVKEVSPIRYTKRDRRGWVILHPHPNQLKLWNT